MLQPGFFDRVEKFLRLLDGFPLEQICPKIIAHVG